MPRKCHTQYTAHGAVSALKFVASWPLCWSVQLGVRPVMQFGTTGSGAFEVILVEVYCWKGGPTWKLAFPAPWQHLCLSPLLFCSFPLSVPCLLRVQCSASLGSGSSDGDEPHLAIAPFNHWSLTGTIILGRDQYNLPDLIMTCKDCLLFLYLVSHCTIVQLYTSH